MEYVGFRQRGVETFAKHSVDNRKSTRPESAGESVRHEEISAEESNSAAMSLDAMSSTSLLDFSSFVRCLQNMENLVCCKDIVGGFGLLEIRYSTPFGL
jgi:hypothetical protein